MRRKKKKEDENGAVYERKVEKYNFIQTLDLVHKESGRHLIQSYEAELMDEVLV